MSAGVGLQRAGDDAAQRRAHRIHHALGGECVFEQRAPAVQVKDAELLARQPAQPLAQIVRRRLGAFHLKLLAVTRHGDAPGDLHRRDQLRSLRALETLDVQQCEDGRFHHRTQRTEPFENLPPQFNGARPAKPDANQDGDQFRIGERLRTARKQSFPWSFLFRPRHDAAGLD
ncbi:MAG TPA: hypothetical protein VNO52_08130 [Methylomirabilota bacterium]|nr:hypothetical protein [Methylomirabilota bacterium]